MKKIFHLMFFAVLGYALSLVSAWCGDVDSASQATVHGSVREDEQGVVISEKEKANLDSLFDPSLPEVNKVALLLRSECGDARV